MTTCCKATSESLPCRPSPLRAQTVTAVSAERERDEGERKSEDAFSVLLGPLRQQGLLSGTVKRRRAKQLVKPDAGQQCLLPWRWVVLEAFSGRVSEAHLLEFEELPLGPVVDT